MSCPAMKRFHVLVCISALLGLCLGAAAQDTLSLDLDTLDNKHVQVPPDKHESPDTQRSRNLQIPCAVQSSPVQKARLLPPD